MVRPWKVGRACGVEIALHWTLWAMPALVLAYGLWYSTPENALLNVSVLLAVYACVLLQELAHAAVADRLGIGTRDVLLFPVCGVARLTRVGERPWQEIWIALAGPAVHAALAGGLGLWLYQSGAGLEPQLGGAEPPFETFLNRLFWCNILLAVINLLPALPLDGGRVFRGTLALSTSRLRATEVAALLSGFVALFLILAGVFWVESPLTVVLGVFVYLLSQYELGQERTFAAIHAPPLGRTPPAAVVPMDQVVTEDCRPGDPNFSGFTWNARARLWIEWKNGEPVSASALIGE